MENQDAIKERWIEERKKERRSRKFIRLYVTWDEKMLMVEYLKQIGDEDFGETIYENLIDIVRRSLRYTMDYEKECIVENKDKVVLPPKIDIDFSKYTRGKFTKGWFTIRVHEVELEYLKEQAMFKRLKGVNYLVLGILRQVIGYNLDNNDTIYKVEDIG